MSYTVQGQRRERHEHAKRMHALAAQGHDTDAMRRSAQLQFLAVDREVTLPSLREDHGDEIADRFAAMLDMKESAIRAEGPVECSCGCMEE